MKSTILLLCMSEPGSCLTVSLRGSEVAREGRIVYRPEIRAVNECYSLGLIRPDDGKFVTEECRRTALQNRNKEVWRRTKQVVN